MSTTVYRLIHIFHLVFKLVNILAKRCESTDAQPDNDAQHTAQFSAITRKPMVLYSFDTTTHVHRRIG